MRAAGRIATAAALAGLLAVSCWSIRAGWADYLARQDTLEATQAALRWMPDQADYHFQLAVLTAEKDPARSIAELENALALNPCDAASWIELGLRFEADGKADRAEQCLLRAAERGPAISSAMDAGQLLLPAQGYGEVLGLGESVRGDGLWGRDAALPAVREGGGGRGSDQPYRDLETRGAGAIPVVPDGSGAVDIMMPAARKVLEADREADIAVLMAACDRLLDGKRRKGRWKSGIASRSGAEFRLEPSAASGPVLTNGTFSTAPVSHGFDWRLPTTEGVSASGEERPPGLRLTFSGRQPENCEVLAQFVPVREQTAYELEFVYRTRGIPPGTGLRWRVIDGTSGGTLAEGESLSSEEDQQTAVSFRTPAGCRLARIALEYRRTPGTTRIAGFVVLRGMRIRPPA